MDKNPFIEHEDYFKGYNESINNLKNNPEIIAFDKICYELFEHLELGRVFMEMVKERYLLPSLVSKSSPTYQIDVIWQDGFKDFPRMLRSCGISHKQRINAGK
jgi:hypothetical protein